MTWGKSIVFIEGNLFVSKAMIINTLMDSKKRKDSVEQILNKFMQLGEIDEI